MAPIIDIWNVCNYSNVSITRAGRQHGAIQMGNSLLKGTILVIVATASSQTLAATQTLSTELDAHFDTPATPRDAPFRVVGQTQGAGWGRIEILEGSKRFRTEGYNVRSARKGLSDTFSSNDFPLRRYFGKQNQAIIDAFNLAYAQPCASHAAQTCGNTSPFQPESRFVLVHTGPQTALGNCDTLRNPVLLVHGAMQDANTWLWPYGTDGHGSFGSPNRVVKGLVQHLEEKNFCVYALTFGNSQGDVIGHAIHVANSLQHINAKHKNRPAVDIVAWSKGVVPVNLYLSEISQWQPWGTSFFTKLAWAQGQEVPRYRGDIGKYISLGGTHLGIDFNWRHPINNLILASVPWNSPLANGAFTWSAFLPFQCANWGHAVVAPSSVTNPYADGLCEHRGGVWTDYFREVALTNIQDFSADGLPIYNLDTPIGNSGDSKEGNLSIWGAVDSKGRYHNGFIGQAQLAHDFRDAHPVVTPQCVRKQDSDFDGTRWYRWNQMKLQFNPWMTGPAGWMKQTLDSCREAAFTTDKHCEAWHVMAQSSRTATRYPYHLYRAFRSLGIAAAKQVGGNLIDELARHPLSQSLEKLVLISGRELGTSDLLALETDGFDCETETPASDGVLFRESTEALDQLTRNWKNRDKASKVRVASSHMVLGTDPDAIEQVILSLTP